MAETILKLEHISKTYSEQILEDISFSLEKGESICVMAPSGKGKSTLLSIAGLLLAPTEGNVWINGVETTSLSDNEKSKLRSETIGFLFQHTQLCGALRAHDNISLPSFFNKKESRLSKQEINKQADAMLDRFGLKDRKYYFPNQLSIGQKRRIACARALFLHPELIIADEPTNDLDEANKQTVIEALFEAVKTGESALLFATHDEEVAKLADKIINL
ncbi:MAG: ABC transporter ATP-binding protein [Phoenicibacter congonensis]|uniref:Putative hemin import ATP-binding protein HrtA n=1 Tax=Phoenicibacter congonensis TaxID=1944646 RepID=A0AA43U5R3_9ACTN|nr:ABC transporter ATP-binding protein [Phoenicibacter congonensis]